MADVIHFVPRVLYYPQVRDRYRVTMKHFNMAEWKWEDKQGAMHLLRLAAKLEDLFSVRGLDPKKIVLHHFGNYDWVEEFGQDIVNQFPRAVVERDPV